MSTADSGRSNASLGPAFCGSQVALFYGLTQPYDKTQQDRQPHSSTCSRTDPTAVAAAAPQPLAAQHAAAAAAAGPHLSCKGRFSGRVLVVPASRWKAADALQDFAAAAAGVHWHASCKRGRLKLVAPKELARRAVMACATAEEPTAASKAGPAAHPDKVGKDALGEGFLISREPGSSAGHA
jgi:hypothetical protein